MNTDYFDLQYIFYANFANEFAVNFEISWYIWKFYVNKFLYPRLLTDDGHYSQIYRAVDIAAIYICGVDGIFVDFIWL
jgi:hypothetical protein